MTGSLQSLTLDLRFAVRKLRRAPLYTIVVLLVLGLGIGATAAVFTVLNAVLLRPLPYPEPERITVGFEVQRDRTERDLVSSREMLSFEEHAGSFEAMSAMLETEFSMRTEGGTEPVHGALVLPGFCRVLGVEAQGRCFGEEDRLAGRGTVALIGHDLWQRRFGGDPGLVGSEIRLRLLGGNFGSTSDQGNVYRVVGILPPGFDFPRGAEVWVPLELDRATLPEAVADNHFLFFLGRLREGVSPEAATGELSGLLARVAEEHPHSTERSFVVTPLQQFLGGDLEPVLTALLGAVGFLLLLTCATVANLMIARAALRTSEFAVRSSLGAGAGSLFRQVMVESVLLSMLAGVAALVPAYFGGRALAALVPPELFRFEWVGLDLRVVLFTFGLALASGLLLGVVPAMRLTRRRDLVASLKDSRATASLGRQWVRRFIVFSEVALALALVLGAGLMIRSLWESQERDLGFDPEERLAVTVDLPRDKMDRATEYVRQMLRTVRAIPQVTDAGAITLLPTSTLNTSTSFVVEGDVPPDPSQAPTAAWRPTTAGYFETMGIDLVAGRFLEPSDREEARPVVVVSESLARREWPNEDPVGQRLRPGNESNDWLTVVGVVEDVHTPGLGQLGTSMLYFPYAQWPRASLHVVARTQGDPSRVLQEVRSRIVGLDPDVSVGQAGTLEGLVAEVATPRRLLTALLGFLALLALLLAAIGIYGVIAQSVAQRRHEIGIRMALGATRSNVRRQVVRDGAILGGIGLAAGVALSLVTSRALGFFLYGVAPNDPWTYVAGSVLLLAVTLISTWIPAWRASRLDPATALRDPA